MINDIEIKRVNGIYYGMLFNNESITDSREVDTEENAYQAMFDFIKKRLEVGPIEYTFGLDRLDKEYMVRLNPLSWIRPGDDIFICLHNFKISDYGDGECIKFIILFYGIHGVLDFNKIFLEDFKIVPVFVSRKNTNDHPVELRFTFSRNTDHTPTSTPNAYKDTFTPSINPQPQPVKKKTMKIFRDKKR